ncbi:MAG: endosialidase [Coprococcus sp.]|nr:endosialidase [Coprococcus sp.]
MAVVNELINAQGDALEFGNYELGTKTKKDGFEFLGDIYKIKTFNEITKLEKNGMFVYESVPGTAVHAFVSDEDNVSFVVEGVETSSITLELDPETEYKVHVDDIYVGKNKTNLGGKINISVDLEPGRAVKVEIKKAVD